MTRFVYAPDQPNKVIGNHFHTDNVCCEGSDCVLWIVNNESYPKTGYCSLSKCNY